MKTDLQLKSDVSDELAWDPAVNAANIGVIVNDGVVTLTGHVDSYAEKLAAERAVQGLSGVAGLAMELDVKLAPLHQISDTEVAQAACAALELNSVVPLGKVKVEADHGLVTLSGEVDWAYQLASAEQTVRHLRGVSHLVNHITIRPRVTRTDIGSQITAALSRRATREAQHIEVDVQGASVTLRGKVHSLAERKAAVGAAMSTHGVSRVHDELRIVP